MAAAGALCGGLPLALGGCAGFRYVGYTREGDRLVVRQADFGAGPYALLENPQVPRAIYLHRHADGSFSAVLTRCMHRGCQVEPAGDRLACPCHGSEYAFTGEVLHGPAERPLYRYRVTADSENIYIELPEAGAR
jgi:Rieske Fe-S protein